MLKKLGDAVHEYPAGTVELSSTPNQGQLRPARPGEDRYLFRSNSTRGRAAEEAWQFYIQLTEAEAAFKQLKGDLALRPIYHPLEH